MGMTVTEAVSTYRKYRKLLRRIQGHSAQSMIARQRNQDRAEAIVRYLVSDGYLALAEDLVTEASLVRRLASNDLPEDWRPGLDDDLSYVRARISDDAKKHGHELIGPQ
jgi:hypothetical protein